MVIVPAVTTTTPHRVEDLHRAALEWERTHATAIRITVTGEGRVWHATATMPHPAAPDLSLTLHVREAHASEARASEAAARLVRATVDAHFARPNDSAEHALGLRRTAPWSIDDTAARQHVAALIVDDGGRAPLPSEQASAAMHVRVAYGIPEDELLVEHVVTGVREMRAQLAGMNAAQGTLA